MQKDRSGELLRLVATVALCQLAGGVGAVFTTPAIPGWYATLKKPSYTPPSWVFGPVWVSLYTLMGISAFLVQRRGLSKPQVQKAAGSFGMQLALNTAWSVAFFGLKSPLAGLAVIILLWAAIAATIVSFLRVSLPAGLMLIPYIMWVSLAAALNLSIWRLNRKG